MADVLHIGQAALFTVSPLALGQVDPILLNQLSIDGLRVLALGDPAGHVPPVAVAQVADGDLLDESFGRCRDAPIPHGSSLKTAHTTKGGVVAANPGAVCSFKKSLA